MSYYDVIIIGGGPAGLTAGLYAARARLNCLLLEKAVPGGQITLSERIENYPGFPGGGIGAFELAERMKQQAEEFGLQIMSDEARAVSRDDDRLFKVKLDQDELLARSLVLAAGTEANKLGVPGEEEFTGKGVSWCAVCDAAFYKDKRVVVAGGGDTAVEEALFLTKFATEVFLVHRRDKLRAVKVLAERALSNPAIKPVWDSVVTRIMGDKTVNRVLLKNVKNNEEHTLDCSGVFISIGSRPNSALVRGLVDLDDRGYIITDRDMKTSCPGIFACGDVRQKALRQVVTACGEGAAAAYSAGQYLEQTFS
jgi:thioredoxin reductase (NADPH)